MIEPVSLDRRFIENGEEYTFASGEYEGAKLSTMIFDSVQNRYIVRTQNDRMHYPDEKALSYAEALHRIMSHAYHYVALRMNDETRESQKQFLAS